MNLQHGCPSEEKAHVSTLNNLANPLPFVGVLEPEQGKADTFRRDSEAFVISAQYPSKYGQNWDTSNSQERNADRHANAPIPSGYEPDHSNCESGNDDHRAS